jgi:hypothetical protein
MKHIKVLTDALQQWGKRYRSFGDYSVTTLLNPPRIVHLGKRHGSEVVKPPEQTIAAFIGSGVHSMFEESLKYHAVIDPRYEIERTVYDKIDDRLITGKFDILWDGKHLYDIKTCKTWKKIFDPNMEEWHQQLNIYAYLLHNRKLDIRSINIIAVYLDWSKVYAMRDLSYPAERVIEYELNLWDWDFTEKFLRERVNLMKITEKVMDDELPPCTDEEMWVRNADIKYAILQNASAKRAYRVCDSLSEAREVASKWKGLEVGSSFIEVRKPSRKRCEDWCDINSFCNQYTEYCARKQSRNEMERIIL